MKIKTSDLTGPALNWAVSAANEDSDIYPYATSWQEGGPIIEREGVSLTNFSDYWEAQGDGPPYHDDTLHTGSTALIAAMRCFVASRLGDEVDVPEEL